VSRKRGALSTEEIEYIKANINRQSINDIAIALNRTVKPIERFCSDNNLTVLGMSEETYDDTLLMARLHSQPYWEEVKKQFDDNDLEYFAITWVRMMKQFKDNILYSEEMQVKQWITLDIMANKVMRDRKHAQEQVARLEEMLNREYSISEEHRDTETIVRLETELSMVRNAQASFTTEHTKILDRIEKTQRDLKAARADRVKKIEDSKSSFTGLLKALEDAEVRKRMGEDLEVNRIAKDEAIKRLSQYHTYEDGTVDRPFLSAETLYKYGDDNGEEESYEEGYEED
jgi:hypothetical protein